MSDLLKRIAELSLMGFAVLFVLEDDEYVFSIRYVDADGRRYTYHQRFALGNMTDEKVLQTIGKATASFLKEERMSKYDRRLC